MRAHRLASRLVVCLLVGCGEKRQTTRVPPAPHTRAAPGSETAPAGPERDAWPRFEDGPPAFDGAHVALELDKEEYFLGENILVHYCIENRGAEPFTINTGGDYRGAVRAVRWRVVAFDQDGRRVADPFPHTMATGGLSGDSRIRPKTRFYETLPLIRYCRFERPGAYTVRVIHDLGWRTTPGHVIPWGETTLRLVLPSEEQARQVVEAMYRLGEPHRAVGRRTEPYADFAALAYPVYLPILVPLATQGDEKALIGLSSIPTPEASQALIGLLGHQDADFGWKAASLLSHRLPAPPRRARRGDAFTWLDHGLVIGSQRDFLAPRAWRPELAQAIRVQARKLVAREDPASVANGAALLEGLGQRGDLPALVAALDRLAARIDHTPDRPGASTDAAGSETAQHWHVGDALLDALTTVLRAGADITGPPRTPGEAVAFVWAVASRGGFRPAGWEDRFAAALQHPRPFVRRAALDSLPEPVPGSLVGFISARLADDDHHVLLAACQAARRVKAPALREAALGLVRRAKHCLLLGEAHLTARTLGANVESLEILASRLDDPDVAVECLSLLSRLVEGHSGAALAAPADEAEAGALKANWLAFLRAHRDAIEAGRRFRIGSPELTPDLFPRAFRFFRDGQPDWPER